MPPIFQLPGKNGGSNFRMAILTATLHLQRPYSVRANFTRMGLEARDGIEPPIKVLLTFALPLGDRASRENHQLPELLANPWLASPALPPVEIDCSDKRKLPSCAEINNQ